MDFLNKLKGESEKTVEELRKWTKESGAELEAAFEHLKKVGKDNVEGVVQWMKDAKLIATKEAETIAREHLGKAGEKINFQQFKDTVVKMAQHGKPDDLVASVKEHGDKLVAAMRAGASGFKEALGNSSGNSGTGKK